MLLLGVAVTKERGTEESKHVALGLGTATSQTRLKFLTDKQTTEGDRSLPSTRR